MASNRFYSYYLRGNQIALVEEDRDDNGRWKSPTATAADGLEIEYAYSPRYSITTTTAATPQVNQFYLNGWTVKAGYLTFVRSHSASVPSWDASPYSKVGDDEYIVIRNSERWNGLHKIQSGGTDGTLQTYTRVNQSVTSIVGSSNIDIYGEGTGGASATQARIIANDSSNLWLNALFSTNDYIFVTGSAVAKNNGFWQVSGVQDDSSAESSSGIYVTNRYFCYDGDNTLSTEGEDTSPDTTLATDESVSIYKVYRDFCYLQADIDALDDESDTIDLPEYLAKALVYYVKAKMFEDRLDIEAKEYFLREFRAMVEKHDSSKVWGARLVSPPINAIR